MKILTLILILIIRGFFAYVLTLGTSAFFNNVYMSLYGKTSPDFGNFTWYATAVVTWVVATTVVCILTKDLEKL